MAGKICGVVTGRTSAEAGKLLEKISGAGADAAELRIDFLKKPSAENAAKLVKKAKRLGLETIVTCRPGWEGGKFRGSEGERKKILLKNAESKPDFIDVELESGKEFDEVVAEAKRRGVKVIVSFHDFGKTPSPKELEKILAREFKRGAAIGKVACQVNSANDAVALLELLQRARKKGKKIIAIGMGEKSRPVRVLAALLGSEYSFARADEKGSAEGQLSVSQMVELTRVGGK